MRNPLQVIPWLGLTACSALWAGYGETVTVDQRAMKKLAPGWVVISERWTDRRIYEPHWPTRHELTLRDLNGAPWGATEEVTAASPRLGETMITRLREIAKSRQAGEHVWKSWKALTPWLRSEMRKRPRPWSVQSGGESHPGGGLPPPATVPSSGRFGVRTPAVLAVGTAAPETGWTKNHINQGFCS
jgi:hypothetical protein